MASACLPAVFRAVEIDGVPYWDGGYLGNPVLYPFFRSTDTEDVLIVQINPVMRKKVPQTTREIMGRVNEITFNSALMAELRAIEFVNRLIDQGRVPPAPDRTNIAASMSIASCWRDWANDSRRPASCATTTNRSNCCASSASVRRGAFSTRIRRHRRARAASICRPRFIRRGGVHE